MNLKLKEQRNKNKYTAKQMSEYLNISKAFYSQLENNKRTLTYKMAIKISKVFKIKPDELFYKDFINRM